MLLFSNFKKGGSSIFLCMYLYVCSSIFPPYVEQFKKKMFVTLKFGLIVPSYPSPTMESQANRGKTLFL